MAHPGLEYVVDTATGQQRCFTDPDEAAGFAVSLALGDGEPHHIDVLCWSREAAVAYRGSEDGGAEYDEDPEASVFERLVITAVSLGRVA